jgi:hypothetical protein
MGGLTVTNKAASAVTSDGRVIATHIRSAPLAYWLALRRDFPNLGRQHTGFID